MGVDNLSLIRWVKSFKTTRHPKEFKMRAAILLFALGVVAFVKGEAEEDPPTKEYENNHGKKSYGYKPQGYGYKTKTYGYGHQPYKPYGGYGHHSYGHDSYGYKKPVYGGYDYYGYQPTYGGYHQNSYGGGLPEDSYGGYGGYQKDSYGGYGGNQIGSYGGYGGGYQKQSYGGYGGGYQTGSYGYGNSYGYKKHYGTKYDPNHVEATMKKVGEYAGAQEKYKKQSLNVKYSYDAVPTEYDYIEKYGWGSPTTVGSLYTGYGYGHHYPQQYGYGHDSYGYRPKPYGYKKPYGYGKKPYGYKSKYGKKPMNEEEPEDNMEDGDWEEDTEENWEE